MTDKDYRNWRFGIWIGNTLLLYSGLLCWEQKRIKLSDVPALFSLKGKYEAVFVDPTHGYTLIRAYVRPLEIEKDPDNEKRITHVRFEFFHRKKGR